MNPDEKPNIEKSLDEVWPIQWHHEDPAKYHKPDAPIIPTPDGKVLSSKLMNPEAIDDQKLMEQLNSLPELTEQDVLRAYSLAKVNNKPTWSAAMAMFLNAALRGKIPHKGEWLEYDAACAVIAKGDQWFNHTNGSWRDCPDYEWGKVNWCAPIRTKKAKLALVSVSSFDKHY